MSIVAGVDFGTLSVRVSIIDSERGRLGSGVSKYPLHRKPEDPDYATESHADHVKALVEAMREALESAGVNGAQVEAMAIDTTGSSVIPVDENLEPVDDYALWCDHRAWREALEITAKAHERKLPAIEWCGGTYSSEWGFSKLLYWLRNNPEKRVRFATALEHCDYITAVLCGIRRVEDVPRSICAMGHKWLWNESLGGLPPEDFLVAVDPLLAGVRAKIAAGRYATSSGLAGRLCPEWAEKLGLRAGIPLPTGALDAHWDAIGAGCRLGDVVNVIGTSTCVMAISVEQNLIPGVSGVVPGSVHPEKTGIEAGLSATGDLFDAIARRAGTPIAALSAGLEHYAAGQTGLLRIAWDNGDRSVLVNPELGGVTLGWNLAHTAQDELFAAIESTAFHTRMILERMQEYGTPIHRVINGGGIPQRNEVLNRIYANVLNKPILVPQTEVTSLGSAIFAFLAAGTFKTVEEAQDTLCPRYRVIEPEASAVATYERIYALFRKTYFALGRKGAEAMPLGDVLPELRSIAQEIRGKSGTP
ncbi:MAG: ribulokinase [Bryobacterales bacterium]|nr:ribulokinase [Bryobacterales bacterium]